VTPDKLLNWLAGESNSTGYIVPGVYSEQVHRAARDLLAAVQLQRITPAQQITATPAPVIDSPTQLMPRYRRGHADPTIANRLYGGAR
jgi:hypothetical protein